jgi:Flp pilus assembly protein TadB
MYRGGGEEETKRRKERRGRERRGEREREREQRATRREANIPYFLRKRNYDLSHLLIEKREERGIKKTKKKKMMWHICFFFFFFLVNWSYFTMSLLYWGLILEALSFYGNKFWALFKKKGLKFKKK